jgi:hypothetical protein
MSNLLTGLHDFGLLSLAALYVAGWILVIGGALAFVALVQWLAIRKAGVSWR